MHSHATRIFTAPLTSRPGLRLAAAKRVQRCAAQPARHAVAARPDGAGAGIGGEPGAVPERVRERRGGPAADCGWTVAGAKRALSLQSAGRRHAGAAAQHTGTRGTWRSRRRPDTRFLRRVLGTGRPALERARRRALAWLAGRPRQSAEQRVHQPVAQAF